MSFSKNYFEAFSGHLKSYREHFWTGIVTVAIKVAHDREFNIYKIIDCGDELLTFAYYEAKKQRKLPRKIQDERGELSAFPVVTLPYSAIEWVELNPGSAEGGTKKAGFQQNA